MRISVFSIPAVLLSLCSLFTGNGAAEIRITKVAADGRTLPIPHPSASEDQENVGSVKLTSTAQSVQVHFLNETPSKEKPVRLRYKLEGVDADWRDLPSSMVVWFRLLDKEGTFVAGNTLDLTGESPGWNGRPEDAPLEPLQISVTAPPQADRFRLYFISHKNTKEIGQLIVTDITVRLLHPDGRTGETIRVDYTSGQSLNRPAGIPANWNRDGERLEIAQMLKRTAPTEPPALFLNDDDPDKFGGWRSYDLKVPLEPGDHLTMECRTAYSIGSGEANGLARYDNLKPGTYWFRVAGAHVNGQPTGEEVSLPILVVPPLYRRTDFWLALTVAFCGLLLLLIRLVLWRRMKKDLEQAERRRLLEEERTRIARDIHDDLGATLAQIAMLSEIARTDSGATPPESRQHFNDIFSLAFESTSKLNEIIWAINPANDTLEHVVRYLCRFAEHHLKLAGLRFRLEAPATMPPYLLSSAQRHNLFLAAKEALHNVVKHAKASEIALRIKIEENLLQIRIEDNGKGFASAQAVASGHGCANMKHRLEQINGTCHLTSTPGQGTVVEFILSLKQG